MRCCFCGWHDVRTIPGRDHSMFSARWICVKCGATGEPKAWSDAKQETEAAYVAPDSQASTAPYGALFVPRGSEEEA